MYHFSSAFSNPKTTHTNRTGLEAKGEHASLSQLFEVSGRQQARTMPLLPASSAVAIEVILHGPGTPYKAKENRKN